MKIVVDANVMVSAMFGGLPAQAVVRAFRERVFVSASLESEFDSLGEKLAKRLSPDQLDSWTHVFVPAFVGQSERIIVRKRVRICRDPKDNAYLSLASEVDTDVLITGDKDLLVISRDDLAGTGLGRLLTRNPQLGARTETEKAGFLTNKKVQAVGRSHAAFPANAVTGTTDKLFCDDKRPGFSGESLLSASGAPGVQRSALDREPTGDFGLILTPRQFLTRFPA